jgi:cytoskeleton protein RodZ
MMSETSQQEQMQDESRTEELNQVKVELPGRRLREQREHSHMSQEEVAHHLRLDVQLIKALENDDYSRLPSPAYICGYLRSYARLLKLPEDEVVQAYSHGEVINAALIPSSVSIQPKKSDNTALIKTVVILIITGLVAGALYLLADKYDFFTVNRSQKSSELTVPVPPKASEQQTKETNTAPETTAPAPVVGDSVAPESAPAPAPVPSSAPAKTGKTVIEQLPTPKTTIPNAEPISTTPAATTVATPTAAASAQATTPAAPAAKLHLHFNGDSWAEVTDSTGKRLVYHLVEKNTDLNLEGQPPFTILLGNAPEVQVFYQGKEFDHSRYHRDEIAYFKVGVK